jgi:hypothetical protein
MSRDAVVAQTAAAMLGWMGQQLQLNHHASPATTQLSLSADLQTTGGVVPAPVPGYSATFQAWASSTQAETDGVKLRVRGGTAAAAEN